MKRNIKLLSLLISLPILFSCTGDKYYYDYTVLNSGSLDSNKDYIWQVQRSGTIGAYGIPFYIKDVSKENITFNLDIKPEMISFSGGLNGKEVVSIELDPNKEDLSYLKITLQGSCSDNTATEGYIMIDSKGYTAINKSIVGATLCCKVKIGESSGLEKK